MSIEAALRDHLSTYPALVALVGSRVHPLQLPQDSELPAVTYTRISTQPLTHRSNRKPTYGRPRFQLDAWAETSVIASQVREAIREAMGDFAQDGPPRVDVALLQNDQTVFEAEPARFRAILDYFVWTEE